MSKLTRGKNCVAACAVLAAALAGAATKASAAEDSFYKTHVLTLGVPNEAGGGYDIYVRAFGRHLADHIPGKPTIVIENVPAGGGLVLANQMYATSPKDGSYIGMIRGITLQEQTYEDPQVKFDGRKFNWLGNISSDHDSCIVDGSSPIKTIADFYTHESIMAASGAGAQSYTFPVAYKSLLGMKMKVVAGYPGTPDRMLALERGEATGACGISTSSLRSALAERLASGKIRIVAQGGVDNDPGFPNVPNIVNEGKTKPIHEALEFLFLPLALGRPMAAPPGVPQDRVAVLSKAFMDTMKDPAFLADAKKIGIDVYPDDQAKTLDLVNQLLSTPPDVVRMLAALGPTR
jgi:tripartite-type tricarboxylate transporter receptor subunit TctC